MVHRCMRVLCGIMFCLLTLYLNPHLEAYFWCGLTETERCFSCSKAGIKDVRAQKFPRTDFFENFDCM